jgi:hypothetical protein
MILIWYTFYKYTVVYELKNHYTDEYPLGRGRQHSFQRRHEARSGYHTLQFGNNLPKTVC